MRKRNEIAELKESSKQLKRQLKVKKRGIDALENMLREATRSNAQRRRSHADQQPLEQPASPRRTDPLKFFVSNSEGLCVEFQSKSTSLVRDLKREIREAFRSKDENDGIGSSHAVLRVVHNGRVLVDDTSLGENGVRNGETLVAVAEKTLSSDKVSADSQLSQLMLAFIGKQQDSITSITAEMR